MRKTVRLGIAATLGIVMSSGLNAESYPQVERQSLYVPVRDGTRLAVNVYRPANSDGSVVDQRLPVIFTFTPYRARYRDEQGVTHEVALEDGLALRSLIEAGYVVAVADIRGKGASFGRRRGFQDRTEAQDGHDLVEWLADQPFSTGKVGMIGCSYLGGTTFHTASTLPPALKAVFIGATDFDKYDFVRRGGITAQFNTRPDEPASVDLASIPVDADRDGQMLQEAVAQHAKNTPMAGLWYGMENRDSASSYTGNAFWEEVAIYRYAKTIRDSGMATYFWSNWHDEPTSQAITAAANLGSKFLAGPGTHCVPPQGFDFSGEVVRYFDHYLKNADNGIETEPRATYWLENGQGNGQGYYVRSDKLPGEESETLSLYLSAGKDDEARAVSKGELAARPGRDGQDSFTATYKMPDSGYFAFWPQSLDENGLTYTTAPLDNPLEVIGYPVANITVSADRPDANVFVYLEEVDAKGVAQVISFGRLKLSHGKLSPAPYDNLGLPWHSGRTADVVEPKAGEDVSLSIAMAPVSRVIPAGTKLRFLVTGADPRQRNLSEIARAPAPRISVKRGWQSGARIDLPLARTKR